MPESESMLDVVSQRRTKVHRDTSLKIVDVPSTPNPLADLNKRTVRISSDANKYYRQVKANEQISVDCLLEALSILNKENPEIENRLLEIARQISCDRQANANRERAKTMSKKYLD